VEILWRIELLGGMRAVSADRTITRFRARKTGALLAFLAYHSRQAHPRDALAELLWPESDPEKARRSLGVELTSLRRQLEPPQLPPGSVLQTDRASVQLNPATCDTDVQVFEAALRAAARATSDPERTQRLTEAAERYHGELLPGYFEAWIVPERERLLEAYTRALSELVGLLERVGDLGQALQWSRRAITADPLREEAHRDVIRLLSATGQPVAALRQYRALERLLRHELRAAPEAALRSLARELEEQVARSLAGGDETVAETRGSPDSAPSLRLAPASHTPSALETSPTPITAGSTPGRLPLYLTCFFGREEEMARLESLLAVPAARSRKPETGEREPEEVKPSFTTGACRLVTLTGAGGTGKSRLVVEAALRLRERFPDGAWFVSLVDLTDPSLIAGQILEAMRVPRSPNLDPFEQVVAVLAHREPLLLLDNFEHLLPDGAAIVQALLEEVIPFSLLVTSRQRLGLPGERELPLAPLPVPGIGDWVLGVGSEPADPNTQHPIPNTFLVNPSVALFVDRAQAVQPDFQLTRVNTPAVAELCRRLEGIPLAIELAAGRTGVLTPARMLAHLTHRFDLLSTRRWMADRRHQSLRTTLDWSYQLLAPELQRFFARLSVFRGGWTLEAAAEICEEPQALDQLEQLRECSLVVAEACDGEEMRYRLLETLREFGAEKLTPEEQSVLARRHAAYFLHLAETMDPRLRSPSRVLWLAGVDQEHDNLRAALAWSLGSTDPAAQGIGLRLAAAMWWYWHFRCHWREGRRWLEAALAQIASNSSMPPDPQLQAARAKALDGLGFLTWHEGDTAGARARAEESVALWGALGDREGLGYAMSHLGWWIREQGDRAKAVKALREAVAVWREGGNEGYLALTLIMLAGSMLQPGQTAGTRALVEEALEIYERQGDPWRTATAFEWLANITLEEGDVWGARALQEKCIVYHRKSDNPWAFATALLSLGDIFCYQGDYEEANSVFEEALRLHESLGQPHGRVRALNGLGVVALVQGDVATARARFEEALALSRQPRQRYSKQGIASSLGNLGRVALALGENATATVLLEESLALWQELDRPRGIADTLGALGNAALGRGDLPAARQLHSESLARRRAMPDRLGLGDSLYDMARVSHAEGDADAALAFWQESLAFRHERGDRRGIAECLEGLARLAWDRCQPERAALMFGAAEALREAIGAPVLPCDRVSLQRSVAAVRALLDEVSFAAEWARGRAMPLAQLVTTLLT
jgi:predicted ATPase/DNA-binding SARP family transcriptional activator/Tfp pilus assembly protein PilF